MKPWHMIAVVVLGVTVMLMTGCSDARVEHIIVDGCEYVIVRTPLTASITVSPSQPDECYDNHIKVKEGEDVT